MRLEGARPVTQRLHRSMRLFLLLTAACFLLLPAFAHSAPRAAQGRVKQLMTAKWKRWLKEYSKPNVVFWNKPATGRVLGLDQAKNSQLVVGGFLNEGISKRLASRDGQHWETRISPSGYTVQYHDFTAGKKAAKKYGVEPGTRLTRVTGKDGSVVIPGRTLPAIWGEGTTVIVGN